MTDYKCEKCGALKDTLTDENENFVIKPCNACDDTESEVHWTHCECCGAPNADGKRGFVCEDCGAYCCPDCVKAEGGICRMCQMAIELEEEFAEFDEDDYNDELCPYCLEDVAACVCDEAEDNEPYWPFL